MYFFVQIERALLREGLEADGALEGPLACAATRAGDRETKQNGRWTNKFSLLSNKPQICLYHEGI